MIEDIPYLTAAGTLKWGVLVCKLEQTIPPLPAPADHTVLFKGEIPHQIDGTRVRGIQYHETQTKVPAEGLEVDRMFSSRPDAGYPNYYMKMTTYIDLISGHASMKYPGSSPRQYKQPVDALEDDIFLYHDTAAVKTETVIANNRFAGQKIAIVGLGGSGSFILDMVSKTRVAEIHLFDADTFDQHSAFRAPGAASADEIASRLTKVDYWATEYSKMRRGVVPHPKFLTDESLSELEGMSFVFVAVDKGPVRKAIATWLVEHNTAFVDVGMGLQQSDDYQVFGRCRVTFGVPGDATVLGMLPTGEPAPDELYKTAIQTVEMNVLNAALAVIRWKRYVGFYRDERSEREILYNIQLQSLLVDGDPE